MNEPTWLGRDRFRFADFMRARFPREAAGAPGHACVGPIGYHGHELIRRNISDLEAALAAAGVAEGFLTAVAPASTGYDAANEYYKDERDYVFAGAEALREEYLEIVNAGLLLQVDDAVLANPCQLPTTNSQLPNACHWELGFGSWELTDF